MQTLSVTNVIKTFTEKNHWFFLHCSSYRANATRRIYSEIFRKKKGEEALCLSRSITTFILEADKFLKCNWLRPVEFKPNLTWYLHLATSSVPNFSVSLTHCLSQFLSKLTFHAFNGLLFDNKTMELMFADTNIFWARLSLILAPAVMLGLKWALRRAQNISVPRNINCITIFLWSLWRVLRKEKRKKNDNKTVWRIFFSPTL